MEFEDKKKTIPSYEERVQRQWEVNAYNDLGFLCDGFQITETDHGWKNETREATDIEASLWEKFENRTPNIVKIQVPDEVDLYYHTPSEVPECTLNGNVFWLENKYAMCLYQKRDYGINLVYEYTKEFRV